MSTTAPAPAPDHAPNPAAGQQQPGAPAPTGAARNPETEALLQRALAETRAWVDLAVIGLNLCPFAKAVQVKGQVRYVATPASGAAEVARVLRDELRLLAATPAEHIDTTVLVLPCAFVEDFLAFNDFLELADQAVFDLELEGVLQVASFHPDYQFADAAPDDLGHATNQAPWPVLHLLREDSIDRAVEAMPEPEAIYEANIATLTALGEAGWAALQARISARAQALLAEGNPPAPSAPGGAAAPAGPGTAGPG